QTSALHLPKLIPRKPTLKPVIKLEQVPLIAALVDPSHARVPPSQPAGPCRFGLGDAHPDPLRGVAPGAQRRLRHLSQSVHALSPPFFGPSDGRRSRGATVSRPRPFAPVLRPARGLVGDFGAEPPADV